MKDITGKKFNYLTALKFIEKKKRKYFWLFKCDCGNEIVAYRDKVIGNRKKSCGCKRTHKRGKAWWGFIHGKEGSAEYDSWHSMKSRCYRLKDDSYYRYGARGIKVCDRWKNSFVNFYSDMGDKPSKNHSLDRIDNNKDYSPENCRWATPLEQASNRCNSHYIEYNGEKKTITQWANELKMSDTSLLYRIRAWVNLEKVFKTPIRKRRKNDYMDGN